MDKKALADFIKEEMAFRNMNASEFAKLVNLSHTTIGRFLREETIKLHFDVVVQLAIGTNTDLGNLAFRLAPNAPRHGSVTPTIASLIDRINKLPDDQQAFIDAAITGIALKRTEQSVKKK